MKAYLNIGTNIGDRHANIEQAISSIEEVLHCKAVRSEPVSTMPWGFKSDNIFLNISISVETDKDPYELLDCLQAIEKELGSGAHRDSDGLYIDRLIDIDIIDIDGVRIKDERLCIPHPHLYDRPFFLTPYLMLKGF